MSRPTELDDAARIRVHDALTEALVAINRETMHVDHSLAEAARMALQGVRALLTSAASEGSARPPSVRARALFGAAIMATYAIGHEP